MHVTNAHAPVKTAAKDTGETNGPSSSKAVKRRRVAPPIDVYESADAFELCADVPGLSDSDLELEFERHVLSIRGSAELEVPIEYLRSIRLPDTIDVQAIDASLDHGVLSVRLPKRAELRPRRIAVRAG